MTKLNKQTIPFWFLWSVLLISITPYILNLLGFDFSSQSQNLDTGMFSTMKNLDLIDAQFYALKGGFHHALLEWSAFSIALLTAILAFAHYRITNDITALIIGLALFASGCMDAFHAMAAARLIEVAADNGQLIPFTWAASRTFNAVIMIVGVLGCIYFQHRKTTNSNLIVACATALFFVAISYLIIHYSATSQTLPQTMYPDAFITRPFDVLPLALFFIAAGIFYKFYRNHGNLIAFALLVSVIPEIIFETHMAFGSTKLFDNHFNIAHFLKIIAYLVPFIGLIMEYIRNYTDQELIKHSLEEAREAAETANRAKSEFLANMSHELRTPMNGVIGMSELMRYTELSQEQKKYTDVISNSADSLLSILNNILDLSKIEVGELTLENSVFDLKKAVSEMVEILEPIASVRNITLSVEISTDVPRFVEGDSGRIEQILRNLIGNAIKFSPDDQVIEITIELDDKNLLFKIKDSGVGIKEGYQDYIFNKFTQADNSSVKKYEGTGLGLAICKQLVEMMGGQIGVDSIENQGAIFWFSVHLKDCSHGIEIKDEQQDKVEPNTISILNTHAKILIAEDHPTNQMLIKKLISKLDFNNITLVENGIKALNQIKNNDYDLVIMDCQMPEMDGYVATKEIRKFESGSATHVPIIALTANAMVGDKEKCLQAGMDDYLSKPIKPVNLQNILHKWLTNKNQKLNISQMIVNNEAVDNYQAIDMKHLSLFTDGNRQEELELFEMFFSQAEKSIKDLEDSCNNDDSQQWCQAAHKFKGASANLGATRLSQTCKLAEDGYEVCVDDRRKLLEFIVKELNIVEEFVQSLEVANC